MKTLSILFAGVIGVAMLSSVQGQHYIFNGDFKDWSDLTGTPPTGTPNGWSGDPVGQGPGLTTDRSYCALIEKGKMIYQTINLKVEFSRNFLVTQDIAIMTGSGWQQPLIMSFQETGPDGAFIGRHDWIKIRIAGTTKGFSIHAYDGTATPPWQPVVNDVIMPSVYNPSNNTFDTKNAYTISLTYHASLGSYVISYGELGQSTNKSVELKLFCEPTNGSGRLAFISYAGGGTGPRYSAAIGSVMVTTDTH